MLQTLITLAAACVVIVWIVSLIIKEFSAANEENLRDEIEEELRQEFQADLDDEREACANICRDLECLAHTQAEKDLLRVAAYQILGREAMEERELEVA